MESHNYIRTCSGGLLVWADQFLFGKRSTDDDWYGGVWDVFGGHVLPGEQPQDALIRELMEELGIVPVAFELFRTFEVLEKLRYHMYVVTTWTGGEPENCSAEHSAIQWFFRPQLDALSLASPEYLQLIDDWLKKDITG